MNDMRESNESLMLTMEEMSATMSNINEVTEEISNTSMELSASTQEVSSYTMVIDKLTNELNLKAKERELDSNEIMNRAVDVKEIDTMAEAIGQIAEQTNLLSLNASIESARTGEDIRVIF